MKGKVTEKVVFKEEWPLMSGSLTWQYEEKGFQESGLQREVGLW